MFSKSINVTSGVRITIVGDAATTWSITQDRHSDDSGGVIYNFNIFMIQTTDKATFVNITLDG
jgi:hypothetical protein